MEHDPVAGIGAVEHGGTHALEDVDEITDAVRVALPAEPIDHALWEQPGRRRERVRTAPVRVAQLAAVDDLPERIGDRRGDREVHVGDPRGVVGGMGLPFGAAAAP